MGIVRNFRVRSKNFWTANKSIVIISDVKSRYLLLLGKGLKRNKNIAKELNVNLACSLKRLRELEKLGLAKRNKNKEWEKLETQKRIVVL